MNDEMKERCLRDGLLAEGEQFVRSVLNALPAHVVVVDGQGIVCEVNEPWRRFAAENGAAEQAVCIGVDYLQLCCRAVADGVPNASLVLSGLQDLLAGRRDEFEVEYPCHAPDRQRWFLMHAKRIASGWPGAVISHVDITQRRQAELALMDSEKRFRHMSDSVPEIIFIADAGGLLTYVNQFGRDLIGKDRQLLGSGWLDTLHPQDRQSIGQRWAEAIAARQPYELHFRLADRAGKYRWLLCRATPIFNSEGTLVEWIGACTDVDEMRNLQESLLESETRFRLATRAVTGVVWELDMRSGHVFRSEGLYDLIGVHPAEAEPTRQWWMDRIHPDDLARLLPGAEQLIASAEQYSGDYRVRHRDGHWVDVWEQGIIQRDASGQAVRMCGFTSDVSGRKRAEEMLRDAARRKDEFLAMLAHELRNPLAPIQNSLQLLELNLRRNQTDTEACAVIRRQLSHLVRLVDDLLDVSRVSRGKISLRLQPLDLAAIVQQAIEICAPLMQQREHTLVFNPPKEPVFVEGDATRLAQVVSNLLNNAAKYTDCGGLVEISLERCASEPALVEICVRDNGRGIEPAALAQLFDLFYQADRNLDRSEGGLGIGLSLVQSLVQMHGGSVRAWSAGKNQGSQFIVQLPCMASGPCTLSSTTPHDALAQQQREIILVVDDNRDAAQTMAMLLRLDGHEVLLAHDGTRAIELAASHHPSVILLDIGLPLVDGYEACRAIRRAANVQPLIVAVTGYGQSSDIRKAHAAGFDRHFVKPVDMSLIRQLLAERRGLSQPG